ncbi:DUF6765 family protein [Lachnospiraceae bacterium 54-53]
MNLDFHYYATYLAACYARFSPEQALVIARSAQMVDDLTLDFLDTYHLRDKTQPVDRQAVTCMSMAELGSYFLQSVPWTNRQMQRFVEVWMAFHFPPGNDKGQIRYEGAAEQKNMGWVMQKEELEAFRLLCLPCSGTIKAYIDDLRRWKKEPFFLQLLGIRMHILADSWAHSGFLGIPLMSANEIFMEKGVYVDVKGQWCRAALNDNRKLVIKDNLETLEFATTPQAVLPTGKLWTGISYLAHARIGSLADYGAVRFKYSPFYRSGSASPELVRDNTRMFAKAFHQMVYAMNCVLNETDFEPVNIPENYNDNILPLLETRKLDQSREWDALICRETGAGTPLPAYSPGDWAEGSRRKDFDNHVEAVKRHLEFFRQYFPQIQHSTGN